MRLNIPDVFPRWATDAATTLEPSSGTKDTGWVVGTKMPARWFNWLHNNVYEWIKNTTASSVSNFQESALLAEPSGFGIYEPSTRCWMQAWGSPLDDVAKSGLGSSWTDVVAGTTAATITDAFIDGTRANFCMANGSIYSTDDAGSTWSTYVTGLGASCQGDSAYPDSDISIAFSTTATRRAASGVSGAWSDPTTDISPLGSILDLKHWKDSTWLALSSNTTNSRFHISIDDGDSWADLTTDISDYAQRFDVNNAGDRIIAYQWASANQPVYYSDDLAATAWSSYSLTPSVGFEHLVHLGGTIWLFTGVFSYENETTGAIVSIDDGLTWQPIAIMNPTVTSAGYPAVSPSRVLLASTNVLRNLLSDSILGGE
jgi:hypothetical protein